ncbi:hypothetical protein GL218_01010 [Daldinia childiae]|uniref:uncharacterized protein n=1 Tax=Daldinia childiae TaxID=326645 RepID=UPI0014464934|nr:uncharacterized protein GL218_01010 [Daldinia childiae]KAF3063985.1 hypothetical protein GL218_01010 [Daldinia childiae]
MLTIVPEALITIHKKFEVLVGVAGPTGSGKTSALNALLGLRGLLATNSQEAATAVPCKVAYNDDDRPTMRFRACVAFRTMENFVKQLDQFFEDLKLRNELQATDTDSLDDEEAIRTIDANLRPTFEIIRTVFGVEEQDVVNMTTQTLIHSNPGVFELLGTTKRFHGGDLDHIAEQIKPYMDSTTTDHEASGLEFAAWPLIDEVEIFVKSEILRNGVVLVDLPGLCDWVESRAAVAKAYFPKLAATLIVTPARRAADDSTSVKLMSEHQELRMKMDGKFHRRSYCVAISQIDEIDRDSALRSRKAKTDIKLQRLINEEKTLRQMKKDQEGKLKIAKKKIKKLEATVAKKTRSGMKT